MNRFLWEISPDLQLWCNWGQRWAGEALRSKGERWRSWYDHLWSEKALWKCLRLWVQMWTSRTTFPAKAWHTGRWGAIKDRVLGEHVRVTPLWLLLIFQSEKNSFNKFLERLGQISELTNLCVCEQLGQCHYILQKTE